MAYLPNLKAVGRNIIPVNPVIINLNSLLEDIYVRYIALNDDKFEKYYGIFTDVFSQINTKMKEVDPYYERYSSNVVLAGSHYDRTHIKTQDQFDVAIVIELPFNKRVQSEDIVLEPKEAGFVQLRTGTEYKQVMMPNDNDWLINKQAYAWSDDQNFLLRSKFMDWFNGVVDRALNTFRNSKKSTHIIDSGGVSYTIRVSEGGPARTLYIENKFTGFKLVVDLVPALKFSEELWPITNSYREIRDNWSNPEKCWLVVPKLNKNTDKHFDIERFWRMSLQLQERMMMNNSENLRQVVRLLSKLRDALNMVKIASYYLKNLLLWEIVERENDKDFWKKNTADLFTILVRKFYNAIKTGKILYFWNNEDNLLANIKPGTLRGYAEKLEGLLSVLEQPNSYKQVARYLLTPSEFRGYNYNFL